MFGRRRPAVVRGTIAAEPIFAAAARALKTEAYADGIADGIETTLRLLLGEAADGGVPYAGELPADAEEWARAALHRVRRARA